MISHSPAFSTDAMFKIQLIQNEHEFYYFRQLVS